MEEPLIGARRIELFSVGSITVILLGCVGMVEYSLVMPSMSAYVAKLGGDDFFYGCCMASFSFFRVCFMPVLGWWSDQRPMIEPFMFSLVLALVGNIFYGCAEWADSKYFILVGRSFVGMAAANTTLSMAYITRITTNNTRTKALATLNGINLLGIVMGPATNLALTWSLDTGIEGLQLNKYTNPGFVMFFIVLIIVGIMACTFKEPERISDEDEFLLNPENTVESWKTIYLRLFWGKCLWVHFAISFVSNFILAELETALPDMTTASYGWDSLENSFMYAVIGLVTAFALVGTARYSHKFSDRGFIRAGTVLYGAALTVACITFRDPKPSLATFSLVTVLLVIAAPMTDSPNMSCYSKRVQEERRAIPYMGLFIGFLQASNGVSRTVAPLYAGYALAFKDRTYLPVFVGPYIMWAFSALVVLFKYKSFIHRDSIHPVNSLYSVMRSPSLIMSSPMIAATPVFVSRRDSLFSDT